MEKKKTPNKRKLNEAVHKLVTKVMTQMVEGFERIDGTSVPICTPIDFFVAGDDESEPSGRLSIDHRGMLRYEIGIIREEGVIRVARFNTAYRKKLNELQLPIN